MRNRITSLEWVSPSELDGHAQNWRQHPNTQRAALREVLERIGIAGVLLAYRPDKKSKRLTIIDGHLRKEVLAGEEKVPVVVLDVDDTEAQAILTSHDPIAAMALRNDELYQQLLDELSNRDEYADIARMLDADRLKSGDGENGEDGNPFGSQGPGLHEIIPVYDEGYDAVIIVGATEQEWAQLQTVLKLPALPDRKGRVGTSHVITAEEFMRQWQQKSK